MRGIHWIDSGQWPTAIAITADKKAYRRFLRKHCGDNADDCPAFPGVRGGNCQMLIDNAECIFLIAIGEQPNDVELASTVAHEATHLMRWLFEYVGEHAPGTEAQAYLVEHVVRHGLRALVKE